MPLSIHIDNHGDARADISFPVQGGGPLSPTLPVGGKTSRCADQFSTIPAPAEPVESYTFASGSRFEHAAAAPALPQRSTTSAPSRSPTRRLRRSVNHTVSIPGCTAAAGCSSASAESFYVTSARSRPGRPEPGGPLVQNPTARVQERGHHPREAPSVPVRAVRTGAGGGPARRHKTRVFQLFRWKNAAGATTDVAEFDWHRGAHITNSGPSCRCRAWACRCERSGDRPARQDKFNWTAQATPPLRQVVTTDRAEILELVRRDRGPTTFRAPICAPRARLEGLNRRRRAARCGPTRDRRHPRQPKHLAFGRRQRRFQLRGRATTSPTSS